MLYYTLPHFKPNQLAEFHLIELNALLQEEQKTVCNLISLLQDSAETVLY